VIVERELHPLSVTVWSQAMISVSGMASADSFEHSDELCDLMAAMAQQDPDALFCFIEQFQAELASTVRSILGSLGRSDVSRKPAEVDFLVLSAALIVFDRAGRWQRQGALPWVWAIRAIRAEVVRWLGHPRVEFVAEFHAPRGGAGSGRAVGAGDVDLVALAEEHAEIADWLQGVRRVASDRDQRVHIEYQTQKSLGDPSPANTVAEQFGLKPANVRQIDARVRRQLQVTESTLVPW